MPKIHLTDLAVDRLRPDSTQKTHWDHRLPGFGIRIGLHRKTWTVLVGPERRRITLGHYPYMPLKEARAKARTYLYREHQSTPTLAETIDQYCELHLYLNNKASSAKQTERLLRQHFSCLSNRRLEDVTGRDVMAIVDALKDKPATGNGAFNAIKTLFNWAVARHYILQNPIRSTAPYKKTKRDRTLTDPELLQVWQTGNPIIRLCILTAQRRTQIGSLRWEYIDEANCLITWPKELMKGGAEHSIPFGPLAQHCLENIPRTAPFLFPSLNPATPFSQWSQLKRGIDATCEISQRWTLHDLRRTTATNLSRAGTLPHIVERILDHHTGQISGVAALYNRYQYVEEMRIALKKHENFITNLAAGSGSTRAVSRY